MPFTFGFKKQFAIEFTKYPHDQQDSILNFAELFQQYGFVDFNRYPGKISPSWKGVPVTSQEYSFAHSNHLWHYHIGIPKYSQGMGNYLVSDWVLHFQWKYRGTHIDLVDIYPHYKSDGTFYMPTVNYLEK